MEKLCGQSQGAALTSHRSQGSATSMPTGPRLHRQAKSAPTSSSPKDSRHSCLQEGHHALPASRTGRWLKHRSTRLLLACCCMLTNWEHSSWTSLLPWTSLPSSSSSSYSSTLFAAAQSTRLYDPDKTRLQGRFLHITDIHPDEFYINGGSISSSCHRITSDDDEDDLGAVRPGRTAGGIGGFFGAAYTICDSPFSLTNATFDWIDKNLIGQIDFVVWTGDNAR